MKVLLLGFGKIAYMPYMNFYLDQLKNNTECEVELIYWDRDGKKDADVPKVIKKAYKFEAYLEEQLPFRKKMKFFLKYRKFALNVLRKNKYDKIIVLHTTPGLTLLDCLTFKYKNKYLLDFRDVSYEYIYLYRKLVEVLVKYSYLTFVSSDAFRKFLPDKKNIYTIHNYLEDSLRYEMIRKEKERKQSVLRISYWGLVRQVEINKKLIDAIGNDLRFELHYYGRMQQDGREMQEYTKRRGYTNVFFHGQYMPEDRYSFAMKTDIIHNVYDCGHTTGNAMGNKYYDGVIFGIPQICTEGSHMGDLVQEKKVGMTIDLNDSSITDKIWRYYNDMSWDAFEQRCKDEVIRIKVEQNETKKELIEFLKL